MNDLTRRQLVLIRDLFTAAEQRSLPLWLENGWAIDARLRRVTRDHEDIDVVYPKERETEYVKLLHALGFDRRVDTDYGFLIWKGDVLLDTEACHRYENGFGFPGFPPDSCPLVKSGELDGLEVRCVSWEAMYVEFLGYLNEIPTAEWRAKDFESFRLIEAQVPEPVRLRLRREYGDPA